MGRGTGGDSGGGGVVGQVTTVGLLSSEVTLSTEKDQSVPVMVVRNGLRAVAVGNGREGMIDVPFIPLGADMQNGDVLVTSGIDGTYPAGLAVATIVLVEKNPAFPFAKVVAQPANAPNHHRFVKVLLRLPAPTINTATAAAIANTNTANAPQPDYPSADVGDGDKKATAGNANASAPAGSAKAAASNSASARRDARRSN